MNVTLKMALDSNMFAGNDVIVYFFNSDTYEWEKKFGMFLGNDPIDNSKIQTRRSASCKNRFLDCLEYFFPVKSDFNRVMKSRVTVQALDNALQLFIEIPENF